jgi:hypothetical protein
MKDWDKEQKVDQCQQAEELLNKPEQAGQRAGGGLAKHYGILRRRRQRINVKMGSVINA